VLVAHLAENRDMRHVDKVIVDLHHILEGGAGVGKREFQVFDCLLSLGTKIAWCTNQLVFHIEAQLPGNENQPVGPRGLDDIAVAWRLGERFGI
jgi:hypothetical protein